MVSGDGLVECNEILTQLESWYARDNGRYLLHSTRRALQESLDIAFGYHILQLGAIRGEHLFEGSTINHRIYATDRPGTDVGLLARGEELPLESDSVDAIICHHYLEFAENPHQVLRELQRVLTPQGHLLLIGFNPFRLKGLNSRLRGLSPRSDWHRHPPLSESRLVDWMHLLGCEVQGRRRLYSVPPVGRGRLRSALASCDQWCNRYNLPVGGVYILHAIKQVSAHLPQRRALRPRRQRLIGLTVPKPAAAPRGDVAA